MGDKQYKTNNSYTDFFYYAFRNILVISIPLVIISALILSLPHSSANNSGSDTLTLTLSSSCTMSSTVDIEHNGSLTSGTYIQNIGQTTIKTLCNDGNGYAVYANGYSNNEEGNNKLINTEYPQYSIDTGLAMSGLTSTWAMKLNNIENDPSPTPPTIESDYNNTYGLVPSYWTKVASRQSGTTDMAQGSSFTTTYAVYASSSQYAGTYQGQVKYLLTHPAYPPAFRYMQDIAKWKNELAMEESVQAIDTRDGKQYWVTKLKDGNVWMTQNLDLNLNTYINNQGQEVMKPLTSENTDLNDATSLEYQNGYSDTNNIIYWTPAVSAKTINFNGDRDTIVSDWLLSNTFPASANKTDDTGVGRFSIGNFYNWTVAIASNDSSSFIANTYNNVNNNPKNSICPKGWRLPTISDQSEAAASSTNNFARLNYLYNSGSVNNGTQLQIKPLWFNTRGFISNTSPSKYVRDTEGFYLSSTNGNNTNIYLFNFSNTSVGTAQLWSGGSRLAGLNVRCVAR
ncbi:hypothetical protein IJJ53_03265 [Candidatus Saccharibacteria bacterium]|nr:hypothetical protein [Candidatus Saccharibacteria bacterium]